MQSDRLLGTFRRNLLPPYSTLKCTHLIPPRRWYLFTKLHVITAMLRESQIPHILNLQSRMVFLLDPEDGSEMFFRNMPVFQTIKRYTQQYCHLHVHRRESVKSHTYSVTCKSQSKFSFKVSEVNAA
jgi:hypothetical protein